MAGRQAERPHAMTTLSTHDTKRGEDVRARITVLAEVPVRVGRDARRLLGAGAAARSRLRILLWQAVLGAWPASRERLHGYAEKAMREAGDRTTWTAPDQAYEDAVHAAVDAAFDDPAVREVLDGLLAQVAGPGWVNALAAKLVALTMPGVPDVYQGSELWEQSLVDPDNRRPVDFDLRAGLLAELRDASDVPLTDAVDDPGHAKLLVTQPRAAPAPRPARAVHDVRRLDGDRSGRRPRARVRPRRRGHRRHPAAGRPRPPGRLGGTRLDLPGRCLARRADRPHLRVRRRP